MRVEVALEPSLPPVLCDRTLVEQVLLNLARNAMQAMDDPAIAVRVLDIRVRRAASNAHSGWLEFSVADCGSGISEETARQLFTPFFTTRSEGMGLGLSLCRTVVEQHGGFLGYGPHTPRGTVFTFTLPVRPARSRDALTMQPITDATVFIVDDDASVREAWRGCCARAACPANHSTAPRRSRPAWRSARRSATPAACCSMCACRARAAWCLFDRLVERGALAAMPVIFLTGHADVPTAVDAVKRGAFDFCEKPFSDNALVDRIEQALALSRARIRRSCARATTCARAWPS